MHRAAKHEAVGGLCLFNGLVDHAAEHAAIAAAAAAAADAAAHRLAADVQDLGVDTGLVQLPGDQGQGGVGAALFVGAAVDEQNVHKNTLLWSRMRRKMPGACAIL